MVFSSRPSLVSQLCTAFVLTLLAVAGPAQAQSQNPDAERRLGLTPEQRQEMMQRLTPEQRDTFRNARTPEERQRAFQGLSPEQRELMVRRLPLDERRQAWERLTPAERDAMRQRFIEQRGQRAPGAVPGHSLTPEERQRLRDQIRDARRDVYKNPNQNPNPNGQRKDSAK
jgi:Spy/CpxP family protein refolding chaperone